MQLLHARTGGCGTSFMSGWGRCMHYWKRGFGMEEAKFKHGGGLLCKGKVIFVFHFHFFSFVLRGQSNPEMLW